MYFKAVIPLFLAGGAIADYAAYRAAQGYEVPAIQSASQDGTEIGKFLTDLNASFNKLDSLVSAITKDNVASQLDKITAESKNIDSMLKSNAAKISSSKAVSGIFGLMPLLSKGQPLLQTLNRTMSDIVEKRPIILEAKLSGKVKEGLMASEPGTIAITLAIIKNVAPLVQSFASKGGSGGASPPAGASGALAGLGSLDESKLKPVIDGLYDTIVGLYDGSVTMDTLREQFAKAKEAKAASAPPGGAAGALTGGAAPKTPTPPPAPKPAAPASLPAAPRPKGPKRMTDNDMVAMEFSA